jgi:hypothetical protein
MPHYEVGQICTPHSEAPQGLNTQLGGVTIWTVAEVGSSESGGLDSQNGLRASVVTRMCSVEVVHTQDITTFLPWMKSECCPS